VVFQLGAVFERGQRFTEAEGAFRRALERDPEDAATLNYLGYMLAERGERLDESVDLIQRALELDPHNGSYLDSLGWAYLKQNRLELAEPPLRQAGEQLRRNSVVQDHLGDLLFRLERYAEATSAWERALAGDQDGVELSLIEDKLRDARDRLSR
jgi:tetratricopeptide (TPR) repeat protein